MFDTSGARVLWCAAPLSCIENDAVKQHARILSAALSEICFNVMVEC